MESSRYSEETTIRLIDSVSSIAARMTKYSITLISKNLTIGHVPFKVIILQNCTWTIPVHSFWHKVNLATWTYIASTLQTILMIISLSPANMIHPIFGPEVRHRFSGQAGKSVSFFSALHTAMCFIILIQKPMALLLENWKGGVALGISAMDKRSAAMTARICYVVCPIVHGLQSKIIRREPFHIIRK